MIGSWILTSDEFAVDNHMRREVYSPGAYLAASRRERIWHIEVHLPVKDVVLDPLFLGRRENGHFVAGVLPALGPLFCFLLVACDERRTKFSRVRQCRDERDRSVTKQRRRLCVFMEMTKDLARVGILHQIDDRRLTSGHEDGVVTV